GSDPWYYSHLKVMVASGQVILAYRDNAKWPAVKPISVRDYLKQERAALPPAAKLVELRDDGLVAAFSGIDALVCPVSGFAVGAQLKYIEAAEAAGVKRFIPSEFGMDNDVHPTAILNAPKVPIRDRLRNSPSLEFTFVYTGLWIDHFLVGPANP
ncbi:hypothetical protein HK405_015531, partial [Cladochytrium tenue]